MKTLKLLRKSLEYTIYFTIAINMIMIYYAEKTKRAYHNYKGFLDFENADRLHSLRNLLVYILSAFVFSMIVLILILIVLVIVKKRLKKRNFNEDRLSCGSKLLIVLTPSLFTACIYSFFFACSVLCSQHNYMDTRMKDFSTNLFIVSFVLFMMFVGLSLFLFQRIRQK